MKPEVSEKYQVIKSSQSAVVLEIRWRLLLKSYKNAKHKDRSSIRNYSL